MPKAYSDDLRLQLQFMLSRCQRFCNRMRPCENENAAVLFYTNVSAKKSIPWRTSRVIHLNRMIECKKRKTTIDLEMNLHQGLKGVVIRRFLFVLIFRCTCIFIF